VHQRSGSTVKGVIAITLMSVNVIAWCLVLFTVALAKFVVPIPAWRRVDEPRHDGARRGLDRHQQRHLPADGLAAARRPRPRGLSTREWYLVVSNHRSWVDILVLQAVFNRRIPFLKFFLKQQLIWVPFLGIAWWALDFPFMRRYTAAHLEKHPEDRGKDLEVTRRACEKFRLIPTSVMNFVEGTRFTPAKHAAFKSPYRNLLPTRAGGTSFVLSSMGGMLHSLLDVTIAYSTGTPSLWDLCCGRVGTVIVDVRRRPIDPWMSAGDYASDPRSASASRPGSPASGPTRTSCSTGC
jgi:1-acyl-sn-glycerol-3-phosphate acyltransferase